MVRHRPLSRPEFIQASFALISLVLIFGALQNLEISNRNQGQLRSVPVAPSYERQEPTSETLSDEISRKEQEAEPALIPTASSPEQAEQDANPQPAEQTPLQTPQEPPNDLSNEEPQPPPQEQQQATNEPNNLRPVMHTFFHQVDHLANGEKGTGMSDEADQALLQLWKEAWYAAGWTPKVLTVEEAKLHPDYEVYMEQLDKVPLWGAKRAGVNRLYNQMCYIRWLAMAVVGGGWMSDYDVLPLRKFNESIPSELTVYSVSEAGKQATPCLMSGTHRGWDSYAHEILQNGLEHPDVDLWSDMFAISDLWDKRPYAHSNNIIDGSQLLTGAPWTAEDCSRFNKFDAVHFSHHMVVSGTMREGESFEDRPRLARKIWEKFERECKEPEKVVDVM